MDAATTIKDLTRLSAEEVAGLPWEDLHGIPDATTRVLWRAAGSMAGVLRLAPGARLGEHAHVHGHHHVWVLSGTVGVDDRELPAGSYVHVPAGRPHALRAVGDEECQVLYLYLEDGS